MAGTVVDVKMGPDPWTWGCRTGARTGGQRGPALKRPKVKTSRPVAIGRHGQRARTEDAAEMGGARIWPEESRGRAETLGSGVLDADRREEAQGGSVGVGRDGADGGEVWKVQDTPILAGTSPSVEDGVGSVARTSDTLAWGCWGVKPAARSGGSSVSWSGIGSQRGFRGEDG